MPTRQDIQTKGEELDRLQQDYLKERGWKHQCSLPGAHWLWHRTATIKEGGKKKEKVLVVPQGTALMLQRQFDCLECQLNGGPGPGCGDKLCEEQAEQLVETVKFNPATEKFESHLSKKCPAAAKGDEE